MILVQQKEKEKNRNGKKKLYGFFKWQIDEIAYKKIWA